MNNREEQIYNLLVEYRTKKKPTEEETETPLIHQGKKIVDIDLDKVEGKPARSNGTKGLWGVDEPVEGDAEKFADKSEFDRNMRKLYKKFQAQDDFFVIGRAGWAKTAIIKKMAKKFGRTIITVYLDKAMKEDLGGIPVPQKTKSGNTYQDLAIPGWAAYMLENPDKKFLLFFDEMNQADPGVMNALMPIVLEKTIAGIKFDNFIVGAAGNFESENGSVNELSGPLRSRFMPIIEWETNTENTWKSTFKFLHGDWDGKIGPDIINKFEEHAMIFENPRELEHKIFKSLYNIKLNGDIDWYDSSDFYDDLVQFVKEDTRTELDRSTKQILQSLAEDMVKWLNSKTNSIESKGGRKSKNKEMIDPEVQQAIEDGIKYGYITLEDSKLGVSEENIFLLFAGDGPDDLNAEQVQRIINTLEGKGITFKYKKNKDFIKDGYEEYKA